MPDHSSMQELPDGVTARQVTLYGTDLSRELFNSPEAAAAYREQALTAQRLTSEVEKLNSLLKPGPGSSKKYVQQDPEAVENYRSQANALLANLPGTENDWERLVKRGRMGLGKMPLSICVLIESGEGPEVQPLGRCYHRLASIDSEYRQWRTPREAEENS